MAALKLKTSMLENGYVSHSTVCVVLGAQWGDEGKGKLVDLLSEKADVVARCQGGNNAGHTVVVGDKAYDFHILPSGIIWPNTVSLIGNGVVIHVPELFDELDNNIKKGLCDWEHRLLISDRAHLVFDFHQCVDGLQETERSESVQNNKLGTTKKGIGPAYSSKANRDGLRVSDLVGDFDKFETKFCQLADCYMTRFNSLKVDKAAEMKRYRTLAEKLRPLVVESVSYIHKCLANGKRVLVEGANATLLDIDFGTYPFVTSSNCSIGGVCTGLGLPPKLIGEIYGVVKAYTTRVGVGPFPTEQLNEIGDYLQKRGHEFGVTTGRSRRCGWLDIPLLLYTSCLNGYTSIALTKLDILDGMESIEIGVEYIKEDGTPVDNFPSCEQGFHNISVRYITMPGWMQSISDCKTFEDLPLGAQNYVLKVEELIGIPVRWIGVGQCRSAIIERFL